MIIDQKKKGKFCVFCGNPPSAKNKEHIIPKWLIEITNSKEINAGYDFTSEKEPGERIMNALSFTFPACTSCNTKMKKLEDQAAPVIIKLLNFETYLSETETINLLDWFDKIRIGLWLAFHYLDSAQYKYGPHFHISSRIGKKDRVLGFFYIDKIKSGYNFYNAQSPIFKIFPSWLGFRILNIFFITGSYDFLLSKNTGYPYPKKWYLIDNPGVFYANKFNLKIPSIPVIDKIVENKITLIGQVVSKEISPEILAKLPLHLKCKYIDLYGMQSHPFLINENEITNIKEKIDLPINLIQTEKDPNHFINNLTIQIARLQRSSFNIYNRYSLIYTRKYFTKLKLHKKIIDVHNSYIKSIEFYTKNYGV